MRDILLSMYEQNEQYHTAKETMFWLSTTLYFGFSAYIMNWILTVQLRKKEIEVVLILVAIALVLVFIFAYTFSRRQNWLKCLSVVKTLHFTKTMRDIDSDYQIRKDLKELEEEINRIDKLATRSEKRKIWKDNGTPGTVIMPLFWIFFFAQLLAIVYRII